MATPQTACSSEYFNGRSQVGFSLNELVPVVGAEIVLNVSRPFVPIMGYLSTGYPDVIMNQYTFKDMFYNLFEAAANASNNNVLAAPGTLPSIANGSYTQYLNKKLSSNATTQNQTRYLSQASRVRNFWDGIDLGNTQQQTNEQVSNFIESVKEQFDLTLFIPPGVYTFDPVDTFGADWSAWLAAEPLLSGILSLEIVSI